VLLFDTILLGDQKMKRLLLLFAIVIGCTGCSEIDYVDGEPLDRSYSEWKDRDQDQWERTRVAENGERKDRLRNLERRISELEQELDRERSAKAR
jgi:hypothetical protein